MPLTKPTPGSNTAEFEALANILNCSVLLLDGGTHLQFASSEAPLLFGSIDIHALRHDWRDYYGRLKMPDITLLEKNSKPLHYRTQLNTSQSSRLLRMDIYPLRHEKRDSYMLLIKDREVLDALEQQFVFASYHHVQRYLSSSLVHDLNAPINTMRITLELIDRIPFGNALGASSDPIAKWDRYKSILREELNKLKAQVAGLPNLCGVGQESMSTVFDLCDVIKDVARCLKHETTSKQIRPELLIPPHALMVQARPSEVRLALLNLACSLLEATPQGGHFEMIASCNETVAEVIFGGDDTRLAAAAIDGYDQLTLAPKGVDIGLRVARLMVERHGGEVQINTSGGDSVTNVRVLLPMHLPFAK